MNWPCGRGKASSIGLVALRANTAPALRNPPYCDFSVFAWVISACGRRSVGRAGAGRRWPLVFVPIGVAGGAGFGLPAAEAFARQCLVAVPGGWGLAPLARSLHSGRGAPFAPGAGKARTVMRVAAGAGRDRGSPGTAARRPWPGDGRDLVVKIRILRASGCQPIATRDESPKARSNTVRASGEPGKGMPRQVPSPPRRGPARLVARGIRGGCSGRRPSSGA